MRTFLIIPLFLACCILGPPATGYAQSAGKKPDQVWKLSIVGNQTFSDIIIKDQIATDAFTFWDKLKVWDRSGHKLNKITVKKDVIRIRNFYHRRGFYATSVRYRIETADKPWKKKVTFVVNEKSPIRIHNIAFQFEGKQENSEQIKNSVEFKKAKKKSEYQVDKRFARIKKPQVINRFQHLIKNMGFAYAKVKLEAAVDTAQLAANLTINCDLGPKAYIDNVQVSGEKTVSKHYVIRETGLKHDELFSLDALQEAQRQLFNHHLFKFATIDIPDQPKDSSLTLDLGVREEALRTVQASVGFGTEDYARGRVSWIHRNAFGHGHKFTVTAKASFIEQTLNLDYLFPYIFNTKSSVVISPFAQHLLEPSYELTRFGLTNSFIYRYSQHLTGTASYQLTNNAELSTRLDESLPDTTRQYNLSSFQLSAIYNQSLSRIKRGWVIQPYAEISGSFGAATFRFQKLSLDVRRFTPLTKSTTLATRIQIGGLFASKSDSLPNNIRYELGGTNSVRGWRRDQLGPKRAVVDSMRDANGKVISDSTRFDRYIPVGGRTSFAFNLEIRQAIDKLLKGFGIDVFLDGGQLWRKGIDLKTRPVQFSLGGGVRYRSPIGPVTLDVGYKLNPSDKDLDIYHGHDYGNFWNYIGVHLSVGQGF